MTNRYEKRFLFSYFFIKSVPRFANFIQSFETFDKIVTVLLERYAVLLLFFII